MAVINDAALNIGVNVSFKIMNICPGLGLLDYVANLFLVFKYFFIFGCIRSYLQHVGSSLWHALRLQNAQAQ